MASAPKDAEAVLVRDPDTGRTYRYPAGVRLAVIAWYHPRHFIALHDESVTGWWALMEGIGTYALAGRSLKRVLAPGRYTLVKYVSAPYGTPILRPVHLKRD